MNTPWIEFVPCSADAQFTDSNIQNNSWQATFACQVCVRPFTDWVELKWGFNAGALIDEALDRQKLFIESQYSIEAELRMERQDQRTLALRLITLPEEGLQVGLLGKVCATTPELAQKGALTYWRELASVFPYDYTLVAASSQADFKRIAGWDLLLGQHENSCLAEVKRGEALLPVSQGFQVVPGLWQSSIRSNEQVWRAMAAMPGASLLNIALQPTLMYENEQKILWEIKKHISNPEKDQPLFSPLSAYASWGETYIKRRLAPWKKFFYLQVHVAVSGGLDDSILRNIATAITRDTADLPLPGFQLLQPESEQEDSAWRIQLSQLQIIHSSDRLEQLADLEETYAVFRLPHHAPPQGLPGVKFLGAPD